MAYNIAAACAALTANSTSSSQHACAKFVRTAIEAGGLSTAGRPVSACNYKGFLPKIGYTFIGTIIGKTEQANWSQFSAKPGDIAVMDHGVHGHICMWNGNQWISDFRQTGMWVYSGDGTCYLFRYTGEISNEAVDFSQFGGTEASYSLGECPENIEFKKLYNLYRRLSRKVSAVAGSDEVNNLNIIDMENVDLSQLGIDGWSLQFIARMEVGKPFPAKLSPRDLAGVDLGDAKGHKTYGWGSLFHPSGQYMDSIKSVWSQEELEKCFIASVKQRADIVKNWEQKHNIHLTDAQRGMCVSCCYNFGPGWLNKGVAKMIAANPNDPAIYDVWCNTGSAQFAKYPGLRSRRMAEAGHYFGRG
jgi:hypothetical protein